MRTTIRLEDSLLREVKRLAAESGRTMTSIIEEALREMLARRSMQRDREPVDLPVFRGAGLQPGVDLSNNAAVREILDRTEPPFVQGP